MAKKRDRPNQLEKIKQTAAVVSKEQKKDNAQTPRTGKQKRTRGQYDLPKGMTDEIRKISVEWKAPASGIAEIFLFYGLQAYKRGEIDIEPYLTETESLKFLYGIDSGYVGDVDSS